jgi:copper chaperone
MTHVAFDLQGMSCGGCVRSVKAALSSIPGVTVENVEVGKATLHYDPDRVTTTAIAQKLAEVGFPAIIAGK